MKGADSENDQRGKPKRRLSSTPTHSASSVGSIAVMPPRSTARDRIARSTAGGACPAIATDVGQGEVGVGVAVDVGEMSSGGRVQVQREVVHRL